MHTKLLWGVFRALLFRGRSRMYMQRFGRDVMESMAHRKLLSQASDAIQVHKPPQEDASVMLNEVAGWEHVVEYTERQKLVKRMEVSNVKEVLQLLIQLAAIVEACKLHPQIYLEGWNTLRLEIAQP